MASAAAASSAGRWRRHDQAVMALSMQRAKDEEVKRHYRAKAMHLLHDMSPDGEFLDAPQFKDFMQETMDDYHLDPHALKMAKYTADHYNLQETRDGYYSIAALLNSIYSYREYMSKRRFVLQTFHTYNRAGDGKMTKVELKRVLQDKERKSHRDAMGLSIMLVVSPQDMDYILKTTTGKSNGRISHAELLPALALWERLAQEKLVEKQQASCVGWINKVFG